MKSLFLAPLAAAVFTMNAGAALIAYQDGTHGLTGNVTYEGWDQLNNVRINNTATTPGNNATRPYGFNNLTNAWTSTLASNQGTGTSVLNKSGGYGYIASGSLHQGANSNAVLPGGNFTITGTTMSGIQTLIFQIKATDRNEAVFNAGGLPTLSINGGLLLPSDYSSLYGTIDNYSGSGVTAQDMDFYAFQWDLTGVVIPNGASYSIGWQGLSNSGIFELQVNQGDVFAAAVPEPSTGLLGAGALCLAFIRRRRA